MTDYQPCDLHEITNCSICTGLDKQLAAEERASFDPVGSFVMAIYPGKCPKCGESFDSGTLISRTESGWTCCS